MPYQSVSEHLCHRNRLVVIFVVWLFKRQQYSPKGIALKLVALKMELQTQAVVMLLAAKMTNVFYPLQYFHDRKFVIKVVYIRNIDRKIFYILIELPSAS